MKTQDKNLQNLSEAVGDFIRYWGFRRIHGQIWTLVYLSAKPLSGIDLVNKLGVSKALVSPALSELQDYELILSEELDGRTKVYKANPHVFEVIQTVLKNREKRLIEKAQKFHQKLEKQIETGNEGELNRERVHELGQMIVAGQFAIELILQNSKQESLINWATLLEQGT